METAVTGLILLIVFMGIFALMNRGGGGGGKRRRGGDKKEQTPSSPSSFSESWEVIRNNYKKYFIIVSIPITLLCIGVSIYFLKEVSLARILIYASILLFVLFAFLNVKSKDSGIFAKIGGACIIFVFLASIAFGPESVERYMGNMRPLMQGKNFEEKKLKTREWSEKIPITGKTVQPHAGLGDTYELQCSSEKNPTTWGECKGEKLKWIRIRILTDMDEIPISITQQ